VTGRNLELSNITCKIYSQIKFNFEGQPHIDHPKSKLAEYDETRVMKHENPSFCPLTQYSEPVKKINNHHTQFLGENSSEHLMMNTYHL